MLRGRMNLGFYDFYLKRTITNENGCMIWQGSKSREDGYATTEALGEKYYVHRYMALYSIKDDEERARLWDTAVIMHTCDVKSCINPDHLKIGTQSENFRHDFDTGARNNQGENSPRALLTEEEVLSIRREYKPFVVSTYYLAKKYKVSQATISHILSRRNWGYLQEEPK